MKHRTRKEINQLIRKHSFLPLFNPDDYEVCKNVIQAVYDGGVRMFECTNRSANAFEVFEKLAPYVEQHMPDMVLGAGTIMDDQSAKKFYEAGAQFIVSPVIPQSVADFCQHHDIFWCPGASTLNEIVHAHTLGADMVKIFPANLLGGVEFLKAIMGPCPWVRVMPTGGVDGTEKNLRGWFEAGVQCVGLGSQLFKKEIIAAKNYDALRTEAKRIVGIITQIRAEGA
jgi:2-dehydro-3-deoxyphosphogluconate aldolase / (4S)-4-hydroxy-2-oxoglutarate aldolase